MTDALAEAGIDISTLEGVQSLFRESPDPWALDCLANWIDVTVNHDRTLYALPKALGDLKADVVFPDLLRSAENEKLIGPVDDASAADRVMLSADEIGRLYTVFESWASANVELLRQWIKFTTKVRRIVAGRFIDEGELNRWVRDTFWSTRPRGWLRDHKHGLAADHQLLAFDMVVRAAQYHVAFGPTRVYQPHPLRSLYVPQVSQARAIHSWGWLVINEIACSKKAWDQKQLIDVIRTVRAGVQESGATESELLGVSAEQRREKLNSVAVASGMGILPSSFKKSIDRLAIAIGIPLEIVGDAHGVFFVGLAWEVVQIPLKRGVASAIERTKYVQRRVTFPGDATSRPALAVIQRQLR